MFFLLQQKIQISPVQMLLIGIGIGLVLGLVPLAIGFFKKNLKLGVIGFVCTLLGGAIWSVLSLLIMIVFSVLIFIKSKSPEPITSSTDSDIS